VLQHYNTALLTFIEMKIALDLQFLFK